MPTETGQMALMESAEHPHKLFKPGTQLDRVHRAMMSGEWTSLTEIAVKAGVPQTTVGSRIRDLRKLKGHEHTIHVREVTSTGHLHVYRMEEKNATQD